MPGNRQLREFILSFAHTVINSDHIKIYFASDFHLGAPNAASSRERERAVVSWLDQAGKDATEIFLVGDVFDFWFEYKYVIPKGFSRLQGKLAQLTDAGIPVHFFSGNHDMWGLEYLHDELGLTLHREPIERSFEGKSFYIGHGDGLGHGDRFYKLMKVIFQSRACQWFFARLHPNLGIAIASGWSRSSRVANDKTEHFEGEEKEWLVGYSRELLARKHYDYIVFGHRHLTLDIRVSATSRYINLGEWIHTRSYAVFNGHELNLCYWAKD